MRGSSHNGRATKDGKAYNVDHNDRRFISDIDTHIDSAKSINNLYISYSFLDQKYIQERGSTSTSLRDREIDFYRRVFSPYIDNQNQKYIDRRQYARCRTIEDYYTDQKTAPECTILQIGKEGEFWEQPLFEDIVKDYINRHNEKYPKIKILDTAIHADETSLHAHLRRVYLYTDKDGQIKEGQHKCLESLGFQLPDPGKKRGQFNNLKIPYTAECRQLWLDVCRDHGIVLESTPELRKEGSLDLEEYRIASFNAKLNDIQTKIDEAKAELVDRNKELADFYASGDDMRLIAENAKLRKELHEKNKFIDKMRSVFAEACKRFPGLQTFVERHLNKQIQKKSRTENTR